MEIKYVVRMASQIEGSGDGLLNKWFGTTVQPFSKREIRSLFPDEM